MLKSRVVGGVQPTQESDDDNPDFMTYTDRDMAIGATVKLTPFTGTYDIFEKVDFFKEP
jgi:hypothetical protein